MDGVYSEVPAPCVWRNSNREAMGFDCCTLQTVRQGLYTKQITECDVTLGSLSIQYLRAF